MTEQAGTAIVRADLNTQLVWAEKIAQAGDLIPRAFRDRAKVLVAIQYGAMLDVNPLVAMNEIHVIEGTPTMSAHLMAATVRRAGHTVRVRSTGSWTAGDYEATVTIIRSDDTEPFIATWSKDRAQRAGLLGKTNWKNYPEAMCKARATTEVCRDAASEALMGIKYSPEELDAVVNEAGEPVDITATARDVTPREVVEDAEIVETTGEVQDDEERPAWGDRWEPAPWEDAIADALNSGGDAIPRLRHVYRDASARGVLHQRMSNGQTLADMLTSLGKRAEQDAAAEQHEDGAA